jgi:hypothetical protein
MKKILAVVRVAAERPSRVIRRPDAFEARIRA